VSERHPTVTALRTVLAPISWGTTYVVVTELLPAGRPLLVAAVRVIPAGIVLALLGALRSGWRPHGPEWGRTLALGTCNFGLFFPLLFVAVYRLPGGVAASAGGLQPLLVVAVTWLAVREVPARRTLGVGVVAAIGVGLVVVRPGAGIDPIGVLAAAAANLSFAVGIVLAKRLPPADDRVASTGWQLLAGGVLIAPLALLVEGGPPEIDLRAVGGFAYLSVVGTAIAYLLWFDGIRRLPAVAPPLLGLAAPITGASLGWLVLGEELSPLQLLGFVLTIGAIAYGATVGARAQPRAPEPAGAA
jgi:probable blue pigment (indigoidine) exporter